ncbi:hypothetical protein [Noviherbaspirillum malthae]|uniref:hypothetical protein n=1 Tax=Noviherbaspirillum malthae TaxID=1260987 RepID=UPI00189093D7|nr:hypothetical protein [Noviherbaspirillum malthae]
MKERFRVDCTVDAGRFASGTALCGDADSSLPWPGGAELAMSRHHALFRRQIISGSPSPVNPKALWQDMSANKSAENK